MQVRVRPRHNTAGCAVCGGGNGHARVAFRQRTAAARLWFRLAAGGPAGEGQPWGDGFDVGEHHHRVQGEEVEMMCGRGDYGFGAVARTWSTRGMRLDSGAQTRR